VKVSQLCKMIEDSIHGGKYPLQNEHIGQVSLAGLLVNDPSSLVKESKKRCLGMARLRYRNLSR